jgi:hypothetical protein
MSISTGWKNLGIVVRFSDAGQFLPFSEVSRPAWEPIKKPIHSVAADLSSG